MIKFVRVKTGVKDELLYQVYDGPLLVGLVGRYRNRRNRKHKQPWKSWTTGPVRFLGMFYEEHGGKDAAVGCILRNAARTA